VVITFIDIDELKKVQAEQENLTRELYAAREYAEGIVNTIEEPLVVLDRDLKIISANHSFYRIFNTTQTRAVGRLLRTIDHYTWDDPELLSKMKGMFEGGGALEIERPLMMPLLGKRTVRLYIKMLPSINHADMVLVMMRTMDAPIK